MQKQISFSRLMSASSVGTILEWYDFSLFAFLTPILASLYFPHENKFTAIMLTYAIFAIGFFVRPLGAMLFGHLGDRIGRKRTLIWSIMLMSVPTFLMGLLPTYADIGTWAPILLIILRICQGLSVGGESTGAVLFVIESVTVKRRGFVCGLLWAMVGIGMLLGSLMGSLVMQFPEQHNLWRIPFLFGILTGIIGYWLRRNTLETSSFQELQVNNQIAKFPLQEGFVKYKQILLNIVSLYVLSAMITYLIFVFMPSYAASVLDIPFAKASSIGTFTLFLSVILTPIGGYLSDIWGTRLCLRLGAGLFAIFSFPLYQFMQGGIDNYILVQIIFVIMAALFQGPLTITVLDMLPTRVRYSIAALGYNVSYSIFGGTAPLIASSFVNLSGNKAAPGIYLMFGAIVALIAIGKMNSTIQYQGMVYESGQPKI